MPFVIPIFRIFDLTKAREFYLDWLGFTVDWEHRFGDNFPLYMQVSMGGVVLHLSEHHGDCSPGARALVQDFPGLKKYHQGLTDKNYRYNKPGLEKSPWHDAQDCMEVIDPFGNRLSFTGPS